MKNGIILFLLSFLFIGMNNFSSAQSKESAKRQKFVTLFMGAVRVQKKNKIIRMIKKDYVSSHLDGKHKGDKSEFLADFLSGTVLKTGEYSRIPLSKISDIRLQELNDLQAGIAECKFILSTPEGSVETVLYLKTQTKKGKFAFEPKRK